MTSTAPGAAIGGRRPIALAAFAVAAVLAAAFGLAAHRLPTDTWWILIVAVVAVGPVVLVIRLLGAAGWLSVLVAMTCLGFYRQSVALGQINLRPTDLAYVLLVIMLLVRPHPPRHEARRPMGQVQVGVLLAVFGISLFPVIVNGQGGLSSLVAWLRLVQTVSLVWLVPYALRTDQLRRRASAAIVAGISIELFWALVDQLAGGGFGGRLAGHNGPDPEGLLAAVLVVAVVMGRFPSQRPLRWTLVALGLLTLGMTRSVGSILALAIVLGFARPLLVRDVWRRRKAILGRPAQLLVLVAAAFVVVVLVRPNQLPGSSEFANSSTMNRVILGTAGMDIFVHHPVTGVGWQRSSDPQILAAPGVLAELHHLYPDSKDGLFPSPTGTATVHDAYIQILAEAGLLGGLAAIVTFVAVIARIRRARFARLPDSWDRAMAASAVATLLLVAIWWNDNPLFGAQPETVLAAFSLGLLACRWRTSQS